MADAAEVAQLLVRDAPDSICVVSGLGKVAALHAALRGGLMRRLIVDEITARAVLDSGEL